eukprot:symbB.v1.2.010064.t3/scaffold652.1/size176119/5
MGADGGLRHVVHKRVHLERQQPKARRKLGYLEKHKDYVKRAKDFHKKQDEVKRLHRKAYFKNEDEFSIKMMDYFTNKEGKAVKKTHLTQGVGAYLGKCVDPKRRKRSLGAIVVANHGMPFLRRSDPKICSFNKFLSKKRLWYEALRFLLEAEQRDEVSYLTVATRCRESRPDVAWSLLEDATTRSVETSIKFHSAVVDSFARCFHWDNALRLMVKMQRYGPQPNEFTVSALLKGLGKKALWQDGVQALVHFSNTADVVTWGSMVDSCVEWEQITEMLQHQQRYRVRPNAFMYSSLMQTHEQVGQWVAALSTLNLVQADNVNVVILSTLLTVLGQQSTRWSQALQVMNTYEGTIKAWARDLLGQTVT